jgi:hypothetical protein
MKNHLVMGIVFVFLAAFSGAAAAADLAAPPVARGTQAVLDQLALPGALQSCQAAATTGVLKTDPQVSCVNSFCDKIGQCASCPGGLSAWYCDLDSDRCVPF